MLGGTRFVGRAVAKEALACGWQVTVFHRGRGTPPRGAARLHGDRLADGGLAGLAHGEWDAVVDTWAGPPRAVRDTARLLADRARTYIYVSSRFVYAWPVTAPGPEPIDGCADDGETDYPRAKRGGELAATAAFGERAVLVRAGLILGPGEDVGRLPWWLMRTTRGGSVLAPGPPWLPLRYIDARDLAQWMLGAAERGLGGAYDVACPAGHATMGALLEACVHTTGSRGELCWLPPQAVLAAGIEPWTELPIWLPPGEAHDYLHRGDVSAAVAAGLRCRPVADTVADTWQWLRARGERLPEGVTVGLAPDREAACLRAHRERTAPQR